MLGLNIFPYILVASVINICSFLGLNAGNSSYIYVSIIGWQLLQLLCHLSVPPMPLNKDHA